DLSRSQFPLQARFVTVFPKHRLFPQPASVGPRTGCVDAGAISPPRRGGCSEACDCHMACCHWSEPASNSNTAPAKPVQRPNVLLLPYQMATAKPIKIGPMITSQKTAASIPFLSIVFQM